MDASQILLPGLVTHLTRHHPGGRRRASPNTGHGIITVFPFATASHYLALSLFVCLFHHSPFPPLAFLARRSIIRAGRKRSPRLARPQPAASRQGNGRIRSLSSTFRRDRARALSILGSANGCGPSPPAFSHPSRFFRQACSKSEQRALRSEELLSSSFPSEPSRAASKQSRRSRVCSTPALVSLSGT